MAMVYGNVDEIWEAAARRGGYRADVVRRVNRERQRKAKEALNAENARKRLEAKRKVDEVARIVM